jgi:hypothetical protein
MPIYMHAQRHKCSLPNIYPKQALHCGSLHHQHTNSRNSKRQVRRRRRQHSRKRCSLTAALAVIRNIIRARRDLKNGSIDRTLVIEIDEEEVWCAAPVSCILSVFFVLSSLQG